MQFSSFPYLSNSCEGSELPSEINMFRVCNKRAAEAGLHLEIDPRGEMSIYKKEGGRSPCT